MLKTLVLISALSLPITVAAQPCLADFGKDDQAVLRNAQSADPTALQATLTQIATSAYGPTIQEAMAVCAVKLHWDAAYSAGAQSNIPDRFVPITVTAPVRAVPVAAPVVAPMINYAPDQLTQTSQTVEQLGLQMMAMSNTASIQPSVHGKLSEESEQQGFAYINRTAGSFARTCGQSLRQSQPTEETELNEIACGMYIQGVAEGALKYPGAAKILANKNAPVKLCAVPDNPSPSALIDIVLDFIEKHPQMRADRTGDVAELALFIKFRCN